jgi:hypothetical protein
MFVFIIVKYFIKLYTALTKAMREPSKKARIQRENTIFLFYDEIYAYLKFHQKIRQNTTATAVSLPEYAICYVLLYTYLSPSNKATQH